MSRADIKKGGMVFYESLCPHGRIRPFEGNFYRNMYFHWRPKGWDYSQYLGIRSKYSSLEEASNDCRLMAVGPLIDAIPETWQHWIRHNRDRGCDLAGIVQRAEAAGFQRSAIDAILNQPLFVTEGGIEADSSPSVRTAEPLEIGKPIPVQRPSWLQWFEVPLTRPGQEPRAWRLDTALAQVYELPALLSPQECTALMAAIDLKLVPSTVTRGDSSYRTSRTCHLRGADAELAARLDQRLAELFGVDPSLSEPLQGQRYDPGQYFKEHTDWFAPGTDEFAIHTKKGGQRTWTVMIYLNTVSQGGQTCFKRLGRCFTPVQGMALAWNNLMADGTPNPFTLHEAMPVEDGFKWVVTKWFRAQPGRNG